MLRALQVAPGEHKVELAFFPKSVDRTETVAYVSYLLLLLVLCLAGYMAYRNRKNGAAQENNG